MAIFNDSVLVGGFFFFLSIIIAFFIFNLVQKTNLSPKIKKIIVIFISIAVLVIVLVIFDYHSNTYMNNFKINAN
jgi:putative effector of murein hydrolase